MWLSMGKESNHQMTTTTTTKTTIIGKYVCVLRRGTSVGQCPCSWVLSGFWVVAILLAISRHFNKYSTQHDDTTMPLWGLNVFYLISQTSAGKVPPSLLCPPHHTNNPTIPQQPVIQKKVEKKMVNSKWQKVLKNCGKSLHDTNFRVFPSP